MVPTMKKTVAAAIVAKAAQVITRGSISAFSLCFSLLPDSSRTSERRQHFC